MVDLWWTVDVTIFSWTLGEFRASIYEKEVICIKVIKLILILYKIKLLSPAGIVPLIKTILHSGLNLMTLLEIATKRYGNRIAIVDDNSTITYTDLLNQSHRMAHFFFVILQLQKGKKVA